MLIISTTYDLYLPKALKRIQAIKPEKIPKANAVIKN